MPTTLTRNYPYPPITGEAPNVALHMQQLAEAIDTDMGAVAATIDPNALQSLTTQITGLNNQATLLAGRVTTVENRPNYGSFFRSFFSNWGYSGSNYTEVSLIGYGAPISVISRVYYDLAASSPSYYVSTSFTDLGNRVKINYPRNFPYSGIESLMITYDKNQPRQ